MRIRVVVLSVVLALVLALTGIFRNEAMYGKIHADAKGYYGYLVAVFLEHSFDWDQVAHSYGDVYFDGKGANFTAETEWGRVNKYYVGTAVLMFPFFAISCLAALLFGYPVDGYAAPFHIGMMCSALFYSGLGIYFLSRFMEARGIGQRMALFASVATLFATNLFHYSISEPAMSHAYSFALFSAFMFLVDDWARSGKDKQLLYAAAVFGLIMLVRPVNGLILLSVPFLAGGLVPLWERLRSQTGLLRYIALSAAIVCGILVTQSLVYMAQVGKPFIWAYQNEGFNFSNPEWLKLLFSFQKGLFVYTPFAFVGTIGLIWLLVKKTQEALWLWFFLAVSIYVISCWWNWYYGSSLGMRALIEYLPFFAFGLAFLLQSVGKIGKTVLITLVLLFVSVNLVQSYQYQKFILHWDGMNQERFWEVFLKTDRKYDGIYYRVEKALELPSDEQVLNRVVFETDLEEGTAWGPQGLNSEKAVSGTISSKMTKVNPYGSTIGIPVHEMGPIGPKKLLISAQVWSAEAFPELTIAYSYRNAAGDYGHEYIGIGQYVTEPDKWISIQHIAPIGAATDSADAWIVYPYNSGKKDVYVDDLRYEVITLKE